MASFEISVRILLLPERRAGGPDYLRGALERLQKTDQPLRLTHRQAGYRPRAVEVGDNDSCCMAVIAVQARCHGVPSRPFVYERRRRYAEGRPRRRPHASTYLDLRDRHTRRRCPRRAVEPTGIRARL